MGMRNYLSDEEKLERIKFYEENGKNATSKKYNLKNPTCTIWGYKHSIGKGTSFKKVFNKDDFVSIVKDKGLVEACIEYKITISYGRDIYNSIVIQKKRKKWTYKILLEIASFFSKNTKKKTMEKFSITNSEFNNAIEKMKKLGIKYIPDRTFNILTNDQKLEIVKYYVENGGLATCLKYNLGSANNASVKANQYANEIGYPKPLRHKTINTSGLTKEQKIERIKFYEEHGSEEAAKKYGYTSGSSFCGMMGKWSKQTGYKYKTFDRKFYTDSEIVEMLKYLEINGVYAFEKHYKTDANVFKQLAKEHGLINDTTKIS